MTLHTHIFNQMKAERIAEALEHFGLGTGNPDETARRIEADREHKAADESPYLKPDSQERTTKVGNYRI